MSIKDFFSKSGTSSTVNNNNTHIAKPSIPRRAWRAATATTARKVGSLLLSASLVLGLVPVIAPNEVMPETNAAPVAKVSFEGKTHDEVFEMMKHMSIDEIVDAMPLKDKVSQLFIVYTGNLNGSEVTGTSPMGGKSALTTAMKNKLAAYPVGGTCYFLGDIQGSTAAQAKSLSDDFQKNSKYGALIAIDEEGGRVQRIGATTNTNDGYPVGAGIGYQVNAMQTYSGQGTAVAKSNAEKLAYNCNAVGVNWDLAPVADTDSNPNNTVIGQRAYSKDYNEAASLVAAAIEGFHESGIATSIKHFPGHGDTTGDTHNGNAMVQKTISQLMNEDLVPFISGISAGTDSVMLGHLTYLKDDGTQSSSLSPSLIATNSEEIITGLLRNKLGYDGVVVTDGMQMGALTKTYGTTGNASQAIYKYSKTYNGYTTAALDYFMAGGDTFLLCGTPFIAIEAMITEVNAGTITEERLDESVKRVMELKRKYNIIPAQEDGYEATYIGHDGSMAQGSFIEMWDKACADAGKSPAPVVRLEQDVTASASGSFGTGTYANTSGDLVVPAGHNVTIDLNDHTLNKNLSGSTASNKHIFSITGSSASNDTAVTIHDSSANQNGKITGANGSDGSIAYVTGAGGKFIIDSGNITGNAGTSLVCGDASSTLRIGLNPQGATATTTENYAGPVRITGNTCDRVIDFSNNLYLLSDTVISNNGTANLYLNGTTSMVNIQSPHLSAGTKTVGFTVSDSRADANLTVFKNADASDYSAVFYDNDDYTIEMSGTDINLVKVEGDVRFTPSDGSAASSGTWDEMFTLATKSSGTLTILRDITVDTTKTYVSTKNTIIDLNGHHIQVNTNQKYFISASASSLTFNDTRTPSISEEKLDAMPENGTAQWDAASNTLVYYEDVVESNTVATYKKTANLSTVGSISMTTSDNDPDGIIKTANATGNITINGGRFGGANSRIADIEYGKLTINNGWFVGTETPGFSTIWAFRTGAKVTINNGIFAGNTSANSKSSGVVGTYIDGATAEINGGLFTGNISKGSGGVVGMSNASTGTSVSVSGGTFCYNSAAITGGAFYLNSASQISISNTLVSNNTAPDGGGIYMNGTSKVQLSGDTSVMANTAFTAGAGIYNATSNALLIKGNIVVKGNSLSNGKASDIALMTNGNTVAINGALTSPAQSIGIDVPNAKQGDKVGAGSGYTPTTSDASKFFIDNAQGLFATNDGNNVVIEAGEAQYASPDGSSIDNGDFKELWDKYFAAGTSGTITLMKDVNVDSGTSAAALGNVVADNAVLNLNGSTLSIVNGTSSKNDSGIIVNSGKSLIIEDNGIPVISKAKASTIAGQTATWDAASKTLTYYTTEHSQNGIETFENVHDLSGVGAIEYSSRGGDPDGMIHVMGTGTFTLKGGRLTTIDGKSRTVLAGETSGTTLSKFNMNGGYIVGNKMTGIGSVALPRNGATVNINGGVIAANTTTGNGTFWINGTAPGCSINMNGGIISGNKAASGAAFFTTASNAQISINGGMITNNSATSDGGAVYSGAINASAISISDAVISANKSGGNGGAIWTGGTIKDPNCHIDANEAAKQGGAIYAASLIADSLCVEGNTAGTQSGGIYAVQSVTLRGTMNVTGNIAGGVTSNLDLSNGTTTATIASAMTSDSRVGLSVKDNGERNQKIVSSAIALNDAYSNMFFDDTDQYNVLEFNNDGIYIIREDIEGDDLGAAGTAFIPGNTVPITAKNTADNNGLSVAVFTGDGTKTIQQLSTLNSSHRYWAHYKFTPENINGTVYYKLVEVVPGDGVDATHNYVLPKGDISIICHGSGPYQTNLPVKVGQYIQLDFDAFSGNSTYPYKTNVGNFTVYDIAVPQEVTYNIHYIYHYPPSTDGTVPKYAEYKRVEKTGVVGQLAYIPHDDLIGYMEDELNNIHSHELVASGTSTLGDWYYADTTLTGELMGGNDSVNDLYVIHEHPDMTYTYKVEYYDVDTGELMKTSDDYQTSILPIVATDKMKTLYQYSYVETDNTVDTIESVEEGQEDLLVLKLYFKKYPTYTIEYLDAETSETIKTSKPALAAPGAEIVATESQKTIDGYDFDQDDSTSSIVMSQDEENKLVLKFYKIVPKTYVIEYRDTSTGEVVGTVEKEINVGKNPVTVELADDEKGGVFGEGESAARWRIADESDENNILSCEVARDKDGDEQGKLVVYANKLETAQFIVERYEYDSSSKTWKRMGLQERYEWEENTSFSLDMPGDIEKLNELNNTSFASMDIFKNNKNGYLYQYSEPKNGSLEIGTKLTPVQTLKMYYAKVGTTADSIQKVPNNNGLTPIERADTSSLININLFDYSAKTNSIIPQNGQSVTNTKYPVYRWSQPVVGGGISEDATGSLDGIGEAIITDYQIDNPFNNNQALTSGGMKASGNTGGINTPGINRLIKGYYQYSGNVNSYGNTALNGYNAINGNSYDNPMSLLAYDENGNTVLDSNQTAFRGKPALADNTSLAYLFPNEYGENVYADKINDSNINYLFEYDETTGRYSYNSQKNHAQYNAETGNFDVYEQVITPNAFCYQFGNFLPFTDINEQTTKLTDINSSYFQDQVKYAKYKAANTTDVQVKQMYSRLATKLNNMSTTSATKNVIESYETMMNYYWSGSTTNSNYLPQYAKDLKDGTNDVVPGLTYDDFYMVDFDEMKNFFFGISFDMNFVQPSGGKIGENRDNMTFNFEGDDDVWVYIDGVMFLNLSGIHRQVGGSIDFAEGKVYYGDLNFRSPKTATENTECKSGYIGYPSNSSYVKTFREILQDAGMSDSKIDTLLNENGTFKDWTSHSFAMYYMERGSGSGIMSIDFNLPVIPDNTLLVAKNITNENPDYQPILSDPFFNMQLVKCDDDGNIITDANNMAVPYLEEGTPYMIYEDGAYTGRTRYADANGIITLRSNQFAVISGVAKPGDKYCVRELIEQQFVEQFDKTTVTNNTTFGKGEYTSPSITWTADNTPSNSVWYDGKNYLIRKSQPIEADGSTLSSTLFENNLNLTQLGALALTKDIIEGDTAWSDDDKFNFAVTLDGKPLPLMDGNNHTRYYVYNKEYDEQGNLILDDDHRKESRFVETEGIVSIAPDEVAVLRYMLAGSTYEVFEVNNPAAVGQYHPVYNKDENGTNVYSGQIAVGSVDTPVEFGISNQRADNLMISKVVENAPESDIDKDYTFELSIESDDRHIDDTYEYEIIDLDDESVDADACELPDYEDAVAIYKEHASNGDSVSIDMVKAARPTIKFIDGKAQVSLKANQKIIIYGLPYQSTYMVTELTTNGEYQAFYKGMNEDAFTEGNTAEFVLDSVSTDAGASDTVEFKNRKIEDLSVSKTVDIPGILDPLLYGKYSKDFAHKFDFTIEDLTYNDEHVSGTYKATITSTWDTEKCDTLPEPTTEEVEVTFENGKADFKLAHGQTITLHGVPRGATYKVIEMENPAFTTTYKVGDNSIITTAETGNETADMTVTGGNDHVYFTNTLIMSSLPSTGGIGLIVILLALIGGAVFFAANRRRKKLSMLNAVDSNTDS